MKWRRRSGKRYFGETSLRHLIWRKGRSFLCQGGGEAQGSWAAPWVRSQRHVTSAICFPKSNRRVLRFRGAKGAFAMISVAAVGEWFTGDWRAHPCSHPDDLVMPGIRCVGTGWRRRKFPVGETAWMIMPFSEIRNCREWPAVANGGKQPLFQVLCWQL